MISLAEMKVNTTGIIKQLGEGVQFRAKMNSLNFRIGKKIKKISKSILSSPVVVEVDNTRVAIGLGMAQKVFLEVLTEDPSPEQPESIPGNAQ
ncbi:MAG: FeoA family protein [bacterium]